MTTEFRLVVQAKTRHWGSEGLELTDKWYVLQTREVRDLTGTPQPWRTLPVVQWNTLPIPEIEEINAALIPAAAEELKKRFPG